MANIGDKKIESQYHYEGRIGSQGPGQVEGSELPSAGPGGTLPLTRDQLSPADQQAKPIKYIYGIDAPGLPNPIPTTKDVKNEDLAKRILKDLKNLYPTGDANFLAVLMMKTFDLMNKFSQTRFSEAEQAMIIQRSMFELGMQNAEFAALLKNQEASKEITQAVGHILSATSSFVQLGTTLNARGDARLEAENEHPGMKSHKEKLAKPEDIKKMPKGPEKEAAEKNSLRYKLAQEEKGLQAADKNTPADLIDTKKKNIEDLKKQITNEEAAELATKQKIDSTYHQIVRQKDETIRMAFEGMKNLSDAATRSVVASITFQQGATEKAKGANDALMQTISKTDDELRKDKDNLQSQVDKLIQSLTQITSEVVRAHLIGRG